MIRVASAGFQHESNTFATVAASLDQFRRAGILEGDAIRAEYASSQSTLAGFFALADEDPDVEIVPLVFSRLAPMGAITAQAIEDRMRRVTGAIAANGPWDGILLAQREALNRGGWSITRALQHAKGATGWPIVLFDVGDNVGGGSPGDSTHILHAARRLGVSGLLQALCDPQVVQQCQAAGVGARIEASVGGKSDRLHGVPFVIRAVVTALGDGSYEETGPTHGGFRFFHDGPGCALQTDDGFTLVPTPRSAGSSSLQQFRVLGIEPRNCRIIVAKGVHSPRPAFEPDASWSAGEPVRSPAAGRSLTAQAAQRPRAETESISPFM